MTAKIIVMKTTALVKLVFYYYLTVYPSNDLVFNFDVVFLYEVSDVDFIESIQLGTTTGVSMKNLANADDSTSAQITITDGLAFEESFQKTAYVCSVVKKN